MDIKSNDSQIDFRYGINAVSYLEKKEVNYTASTPTLNLFFNGDLVSSKLSKMYRGFNGDNLIDSVCRPCDKEYQALKSTNHHSQADAALTWCKHLPAPIEPELKQRAQAVLEEIVSLQTHQQIQRKLLLSA